MAWMAYSIKYNKELNNTNNFIKKERERITRDGVSAFVFANGPSLSSIDLLKIKKMCDQGDFDLIAINSFLSKSASLVKPKFAIFADNIHFSGGDNQYTQDIEICKAHDIVQLVPAKYAGPGSDGGLRYGFCNICDLDSDNVDSVVKPSGYYGVTAFYAISLAKMLGYKNIYICGFDNSYFKDFEVGSDGQMFVRHRHYYDDEKEDVLIPFKYKETSEFFFDSYRHFNYIEKIARGDERIKNIAISSYISSVPRFFELDVYKDDIKDSLKDILC